MEDYTGYSTYLLVKKYLTQDDKNSAEAREIEKLLVEDLNLSKRTDFSTSAIQEKLTKIYNGENQKIAKFIKISAWVFIVLTGFQVLKAISSGLFQGIGSDGIFQIKNFFSGNLNPMLEFYIQHPTLFYFLSLVIILAMLLTSIGVLYKYDLARKIGVVFLGYKILQNIVEPLLVKFIYPNPNDLAISIPKSIADSIYQSTILISLFGSIIFIIIYGWLLYKYTNQDIVSEFK